MSPIDFEIKLSEAVSAFAKHVQTQDGSWTIKGFIDDKCDIYTISSDTKVISKIIELLIFPSISQFARENGFEMILAREQNHYPDITFRDKDGDLFAVDLKSSFRRGQSAGFALGAFTGYFRNRTSAKNVTFPYDNYKAHFVLGVIYSLTDQRIDECRKYTLDDLDKIVSIVRDLEFFVQEKWKIASDRPGSGNTKNIGSVGEIEKLKAGGGPFAELGVEVFDDYWTHYLTRDMASAAQLEKPYYGNLDDYLRFKGLTRRDQKR